MFSFVLQQEEPQRDIGTITDPIVGPIAESVALAANRGVSGKPRLICSHCSLSDHTVEKCYKLHGYPPGYKFKEKGKLSSFAASVR